MKKLLIVAGGCVGLFVVGAAYRVKDAPKRPEAAAPAPAAPPPPPAPKPAPEPAAPTPTEAEEETEERTVMINGAELPVPELTKNERTLAERLLRETQQLLTECRAMQDAREGDLAKCGAAMRVNQPKAKKLLEQADGLPVQFRLSVGIAANHLGTGCSCADSALSFADRAEKSLNEARAALEASTTAP